MGKLKHNADRNAAMKEKAEKVGKVVKTVIEIAVVVIPPIIKAISGVKGNGKV